jgi:hypothetical protein
MEGGTPVWVCINQADPDYRAAFNQAILLPVHPAGKAVSGAFAIAA